MISKIKEFITIITGKKEKKALRKLIRLIKNLLRHFRVKVYKTKLTNALGEPDLTGIATGVISWIPIVYSDGASIFPDFTADEAFHLILPTWQSLFGKIGELNKKHGKIT